MLEKEAHTLIKEHPSMPLLDRPITQNEMIISELALAVLMAILVLGKKTK